MNARLLLALLLAMPSAACTRDGGAGRPAAAGEVAGADVLRREVGRGPVRVVQTVEPKAPRLSDEPVYTLAIDAEDGVEVTIPPFVDSVGGFRVRDYSEPLPKASTAEEGRRTWTQVYRLEPLASGAHVIAPVEITFVDRRPRDGDGEEHVITTEPLDVEVTSSFGDDAPDLAAAKPPVAPQPVAVPDTRASRWPLAAAIATGATLLAALWFALARRRRAGATRAPSPQERARGEFEALAGDDLPLRDAPGFFVALTGIVRRYIERTTGLRAPEQTTEEFLAAMRGHPGFDAAQKERLRAFLEAADLVKFAALRPTREDVDASFARAQEFCGLPATLRLRAGRAA